jgi:hypothetical protein
MVEAGARRLQRLPGRIDQTQRRAGFDAADAADRHAGLVTRVAHRSLLLRWRAEEQLVVVA